MKEKIRLFTMSFFCTLAAVALLCGFAVADSNTRSTGYGEFTPMVTAQQVDPLHHRFSVMGESYEVCLDGVNTAAKYAQQLICFVPAGGRLAMKLLALGRQSLG